MKQMDAPFLTPSNVPGTHNGAAAARIEELACPRCDAHFEAVIGITEPSNGAITCPSCASTFPIVRGVPHFAIHLQDQAQTASSFGFAWKAFWKGSFDKETVFGLKTKETRKYFLSSFGIDEAALNNAIVLDAGTGSGRVPMALRNLDCRVYAVDIHNSLDVVNGAICSDSVRVYQADLLKLPFRDGYFDYVWSSGVIHHTPDTEQAFAALAAKVKPGGRLFISVYGTMRHHYRLMRRVLGFAPKLPTPLTYALASIVAVPLYLSFNVVLLYVRSRWRNRKGPYAVLGFSIEDIEHKSYRSILLNLFDQLHPKYQHEHSVEEVARWFENNGFVDLVATNVVGMVEMRGVKRVV